MYVCMYIYIYIYIGENRILEIPDRGFLEEPAAASAAPEPFWSIVNALYSGLLWSMLAYS